MQSKTVVSEDKRSTKRFIIPTLVVVVIVVVIAGIAMYRERIMPFRTTVLIVNEASIDMRYFLKRVAISGEPPIQVLQTLTEEEILKQTVTKPPYNIKVSEHQVERFSRDMFRGENETIGEREFKEWYRQQLNEIRFSDDEYRAVLKTMLLRVEMSEYLADRISPVAEQVFVNAIPVTDFSVGIEVKQKYDSGEDFSALAFEYSVDPILKKSEGIVGWCPKGILDRVVDSVAFELEISEASDPVYINNQSSVVIMISDKADARQIDEQLLSILKDRALDEWLLEEKSKHRVEFHGFTNGYDSETDAWVNWQLMRMKRKR